MNTSKKKYMKRIVSATIAIITLSGIGYLVYSLTQGDENNDDVANNIQTQEQAIVEVDTMSLSLQTFQKQILCNGRLSAIHKAELMCPKSGEILQSVNVQNGQHVSEGTLLAVADTRDREAELDKAKHDLERARVELQDKLIGLGYDVGSATSEADLARLVPADVLKRAEVTSGYYSAKFSVQSAQKALADCRLTAPFD